MARPKKKNETAPETEAAPLESAQVSTSLTIQETVGAVNEVPVDATPITRDEYVKMLRSGSPVVVVAGTPKKYYLLSKKKK
jgi:hypothetical protein